MKIVAISALMAVVAAAPAFANTCVRTSDIVSANSDDGKQMVFHMRDGRTLINHLETACPGLKFNGFAWIVRGSQVCEDMQSLRVLNSGEVCMLGKFGPPA